MMNDERLSILERAMENEEFSDKVAMCSSQAELEEIMASIGIQMTAEELSIFVTNVKQALSEDNEISEADLENVPGGIGVVTAICIIGAMYVAGRLYGRYAKKKLGGFWC